MNAVLMDDAIIGEESIIGALSFVPSKMEIPRRSLVVGNPARILKTVSDEMIAWKTEGTALYQALPKECHDSLLLCEPLTAPEENRPTQNSDYKTWNSK
jgi:carbonic anhydrase/acetyltransferase-like protein (isoleucine patch superfamily)